MTTRDFFHALLNQYANRGSTEKSKWAPDLRFNKLFMFTRCLCPDPGNITFHLQ
jgi:hypothetical protein